MHGSEAFSDEISITSPQKILYFYYQKCIFRINYPKNTCNLIIQKASLVHAEGRRVVQTDVPARESAVAS